MSIETNKEMLDWVFNRNSDTKAILRQLGEGITTRIFVGKDSMLSFVRIDPHTQGSIHSHPEEQWGILLEGVCTRLQGDKEVDMVEGDFWYSPPNEVHGIRTKDRSAVVLDVFSPPRPAYRTEGKGFGGTSDE
ncbi:MAG: cupin domain-containing protein [Candidatus Kariarchaeaceae archaeon]